MNSDKRTIQDNPCPESWEGMKKVTGGRFCSICKTKVYDLSKKSLNDIEKNYINKNICVSMTQDQLDEFRLIHPMKRFAMAAFLVFGTSLFSVTYSQDNPNTIEVRSNVKCRVSGKVIYKRHGPSVGREVTIETNNTSYTAETDEKGKYFVEISYGEIIKSIDGVAYNIKIQNRKSIKIGTIKLKYRMGRTMGCPAF